MRSPVTVDMSKIAGEMTCPIRGRPHNFFDVKELGDKLIYNDLPSASNSWPERFHLLRKALGAPASGAFSRPAAGRASPCCKSMQDHTEVQTPPTSVQHTLDGP